MIEFPNKRVWGFIGAPRSGKDTAAQYLQESRNFVIMAFADKIKEEFGINKEDFENAKLSNSIDKIRKQLWEFSANKRAKDPLYFIRAVIDDAKAYSNSVIITDIRTKDELDAVMEIGKVYWILDSMDNVYDSNTGFIKGSELLYDYIIDNYTSIKSPAIKIIENKHNQGIYNFFKSLEQIFFMEDVMDLLYGPNDKFEQRLLLEKYIAQFNVAIK